MQIILQDFLSRIKREMKGDSVYAFAKKLGISQQTADCYINGKRKPSLDFLYRVCCVCGCSADELLGLPTRADSQCIMTALANLRDKADQAKESLTSLLIAIDKVKTEARKDAGND